MCMFVLMLPANSHYNEFKQLIFARCINTKIRVTIPLHLQILKLVRHETPTTRIPFTNLIILFIKPQTGLPDPSRPCAESSDMANPAPDGHRSPKL